MELHQLILDARDCGQALTERTLAIADERARAERAHRVTRAWLYAGLTTALLLHLAGTAGLPL